jgi:hypothetical protein
MLPDDLKSQVSRIARDSGMSLGEIIRESLESWLKGQKKQLTGDPLFHDVPVFEGSVPQDYSLNHDKYLYGE